MGDYHVDRPEVEDEQSLELTGTNSPNTLVTLRCRLALKVLHYTAFRPVHWSLGSRPDRDQISGADSGGVPPVPIPNTAVKTASADGSRTAGSLESRTAPDLSLGPAARKPVGFLLYSRLCFFFGATDARQLSRMGTIRRTQIHSFRQLWPNRVLDRLQRVATPNLLHLAGTLRLRASMTALMHASRLRDERRVSESGRRRR